MTDPTPGPKPPRRPRYRGTHPRRFHEKYKELDPSRDPETLAKVIASGKTPAGSHRPIMTREVIALLDPRPGQTGIDATLGYGGHAQHLLEAITPGGHLIGIDADPIEFPSTVARLRALGHGPGVFTAHRSNFAALPALLAQSGRSSVDFLLADLGCSSMQFDNPDRGFSIKADGPLDMRMNPARGPSARDWLARVDALTLARVLRINSDEPDAERLATVLAGRDFPTTTSLAAAIRAVPGAADPEDATARVRRVFQAIRIEVNDELGALNRLLALLPTVLAPGGRVAILTFHSGEDRLVKRAFRDGLESGTYSSVTNPPLRPTAAECHDNPRASPAKLRGAILAAAPV